MIALIVAMDKNNLIGINNSLPWHLPEDLKHFKNTTKGATVIMGRKTYESLPIKPLPNRENIVLTRSADKPKLITDGFFKSHTEANMEYVLELTRKNPDNDYFVMGGSQIYEQFLPYADFLYITRIDYEFEGDAYFPQISMLDWKPLSFRKGVKNEKNPYDYYFELWERVTEVDL